MSCRIIGIYLDKNNKIEKFEKRWNLTTLPDFRKDKKFYMGIDQSLRNTGIWLRSEDGNQFIMTEFKKVDAAMTDDEFTDDLTDFLAKITEGLNVTQVVFEKPMEYKGKKFGNTVQRLITLLGRLEGFIKYSPAFPKNVKLGRIQDSTWKKIMKMPGRPKGTFDDKYWNAHDISERFKILRPMLTHSSATYDAFDAVGVLEAYLMDKNGGTGIVSGTIKKARMICIPVYASTIPELVEKSPIRFRIGCNKVNYNSQLSIYGNIKSCPLDVPSMIVVKDDKAKLCFRWVLGRPKPDDNLVLLVIKKSSLLKSDMNEIEALNHKPIIY